MTRESLQTLAIPTTASYAEIVALLARSPAPQVALLFPLHVPSPLAQVALMDALRARCQQLGKSLLIIGGDEQLRACAVLAGLGVATTLDDWRAAQSGPSSQAGAWTWESGWHRPLAPEYTTHPSYPSQSAAHPAAQPTGAHRVSTPPAAQRAPLRLVERDPESAGNSLYDFSDPWDTEPPAFVNELLTEMRQRRQGYDQERLASPPHYVAPTTDPFTDSAEREALTSEIERYEAAIADKIRITSAPVLLSASHPSQPSHPGGVI